MISHVLDAGYRSEATPGQDPYGLSTDPYDMHSEMYSRGGHTPASRMGNYGYQPEGFLDWQHSPSMHTLSSGKQHPASLPFSPF